MFYDLNVPYSTTDASLPRTLAFLHELGYNVLALNHTLSGKLPPSPITSHIPTPLPTSLTTNLPPKLTILRRVTLTLTEAYQNARLAELARAYDILAVRPVDERTLALACGSLDCDIISLDLSTRQSYFFKHKMLMEAIRAGKRIEICYASATNAGSGSSEQARRNLISNAAQLIRATRGRGVIISSEARSAVACRGPWDVVNLAAVWGLGQERGAEAVGREARGVVVSAELKRSGYRGVVDVVYGGEKPPPKTEGQAAKGFKRKAEAEELLKSDLGEGEKLSKTQIKKRARLELARKKEAEAVGDAEK